MLCEIEKRKCVWLIVRVFFTILVATYFAIIAAVVVHEAVGHGLVAMALGGDFRGIGIYWDGMGWADVDIIRLSPVRQAMVFAGGFISTTIVAAILFFSSFRLRKKPFSGVVITPIAFAFLMDGAPYFFWDGIFKGGIGDVSGILRLYPGKALQIFIISSSAVLILGGIILFNALMYRNLRLIFSSEKNNRKTGIIIAAVLFALQTLAWLSFDWSQIVTVSGINLWAHLTHIALTAICLGSVVAIGERRKNMFDTDGMSGNNKCDERC